MQPPGNTERPGNGRPQAPNQTATQRGRGERGGEPGAGNHPQGQGDEGRRKRSPARYVGWGDELERAYCNRMVPGVPGAFPVAAHSGTATIRATVVARRPAALLLCTYDHCGPHVWPDGDIVSDEEAEVVTNAHVQR